MSREVQGVPCLQLEDFAPVAANCPPGAVVALACIHCQCRLLHVDYLPDRKILGFRCGSCGHPAMNPVIPESAAHVEGSTVPGMAPSGIVMS